MASRSLGKNAYFNRLYVNSNNELILENQGDIKINATKIAENKAKLDTHSEYIENLKAKNESLQTQIDTNNELILENQ